MSALVDGVSEFVGAFSDSVGNYTSGLCQNPISHYKFYQFALIPATIIVLLFTTTKQRRHKLLSILDGRPALVFPMDTLTRSSRISYCCAFGATSILVYQITLDQTYAIDYDGPITLRTLIAVLSMFIYGMVLFPVFACLALRTAFGYFFGSLYIWMLEGVEIYKVTACNLSTDDGLIRLLRSIPSLICYTYLSISIPFRFCIAVYRHRYFASSFGERPYNELVEDVRKSFQGQHVRKLLAKPKIEEPPSGCVEVLKSSLLQLFEKVIYKREKGFRYPSRLLSVMVVAAIVVYVLTVEFLWAVFAILDKALYYLELAIEAIDYTAPEAMAYSEALDLAWYTTFVIKMCLLVSISVSGLISIITILHMLSSFRENLCSMYKADYRLIPSPYESSAVSLCVGSMKYAGFQVAHIIWSYIICCIVLFIICFILAVIIVLLISGYTDWLVYRILQVWPGVVCAIALMLIQNLTAKFFFLQDRGEWLRLDNRRSYFVFVYYMFFYNVFLGLVSCLIRIMKAVFVGTIFLARLDNSTLPRKFEWFDPGFKAYQGYIHMEAAHTHPVVITFIRLLSALRYQKNREEDGQSVKLEMQNMNGASNDMQKNEKKHKTKPSNNAALFNWLLVYTLLHNPSIRIYRKGFIQALRKAKKEGKKIPISDRPIGDLELIQSVNEENQEETNKEHETDKHGCKERETDYTVKDVSKCQKSYDISPTDVIVDNVEHTDTYLRI